MARYSRRSGPTVELQLTPAFQDIPGLSITRSFDAGELLILSRCYLGSTSVSESFVRTQFTVDGVAISGVPASSTLEAGDDVTITDVMLHPITAGIHTIALQARGSGVAGDVVEQDGTFFTVIQLPLWDRSDDIS